MRGKIRFVVFALIAAGVFGWAVGGCSGGKDKGGGKVVEIALIAPLSGDIAAMGQGMKNGATLAIEEANQRADVKAKGIVFKLVAVDDRGDPKEAKNGAYLIVSKPNMMGVVGHLNSQCSIPASEVYNRKSLVMISPASTNPKLTAQGYKNVFRDCTTDNVQGGFAADRIFKLGKKRVAIIHDKTTYGQGLAEEFKKQLVKDGGTALSFDSIALGDKDFKALLTRIRESKPDAIYFGGMYTEAGLISMQSKELGMNVPLMGGDGIFSPEFPRIGGKATEGDMATMIGAPPERLPSAAKFLEDYKKRFPGVLFQPYDAYTYDATAIIIEAVLKAGANRGAVVDYVSKIKYQGVIGLTEFDSKGDTLNKLISAYVVKGGKFVPID
jgi:branched-chain amino acid transport system substrate-binding protein